MRRCVCGNCRPVEHPITALTTFLCDIAGRDSTLDRSANAARNAGALQSLDAVSWLISLTLLDPNHTKEFHHEQGQACHRSARLRVVIDSAPTEGVRVNPISQRAPCT